MVILQYLNYSIYLNQYQVQIEWVLTTDTFKKKKFIAEKLIDNMGEISLKDEYSYNQIKNI